MDLAHAVEANMAEWVLAKASTLDDVAVHRDQDACWTHTRKSAPSNTVVLARFTEASASRRVGEILKHSLAIKAACNWISGPLSQPASLPDVLRAAGFSCRIHCAGMACDLSEVPSAVKAPRGVGIEGVNQHPSFEPLTTEHRKRSQAMMVALAAGQPKRAWHFAATLDSQPVGRTTLFVGAGVAGIFDVEVLKHARYRGIGTALVHAALQKAIAEGHTHAVLAATGAGFGVYQRLGFREVTKISFWRFGSMRQQ